MDQVSGLSAYSQALDNLPAIEAETEPVQQQKATGTDGRAEEACNQTGNNVSAKERKTARHSAEQTSRPTLRLHHHKPLPDTKLRGEARGGAPACEESHRGDSNPGPELYEEARDSLWQPPNDPHCSETAFAARPLPTILSLLRAPLRAHNPTG